MQIPTIQDLKNAITKEIPRLEVRQETNSRDEEVLVHENDKYIVTFKIRETSLRKTGYMVSVDWDFKGYTTQMGTGHSTVEQFIESAKNDPCLELSDYEQISLF